LIEAVCCCAVKVSREEVAEPPREVVLLAEDLVDGLDCDR